MICIKDEDASSVAEHDQVLLQTFGFGYDGDDNRAVTVLLWYLSCLSPEHQQVWNAKRLEGDYKMHPDYYRTTIIGDFPEGISLCEAFVEELETINKMAGAMGRQALFRDTLSDPEKRRSFTFLIRPTQEEYERFVHQLDKLISDNIDIRFFANEVEATREIQMNDGRVKVEQKGSLQQLDEWIRKFFRPADPAPVDEMLETFRAIRKERQRPAHRIEANKFDQAIQKMQRELMERAYTAIRTLRLLLADHPRVGHIEMSEHLREGKVWSF